MLGTQTVRRGEWTLLLLRAPGEPLVPGGVLLLDPISDKLYVRLRTDLVNLDPDVLLVWEELEADLIQKAAEMGGSNVLHWLEGEASHTISTGDRQQIQITTPELALSELFAAHVRSSVAGSRSKVQLSSERVFSAAELAAARERLPISKVTGIQVLKAFQNPVASYEQIGGLLAKDPVISAHLIKLGNLASVSRGQDVRSVSQALTRIGSEQAKLHIWAICARNLFSSPNLQRIWNHSLLTANVVDELCVLAGYSKSADARLLALLHDIGHLVISALGPRYRGLHDKLLAEGLYPVEIERRLCGSTHGEIGADLLKAWLFPDDMVEAVRHHHNPSRSSATLTSLLYCGECWTDMGEDIYDPVEHSRALSSLGINDGVLRLGSEHKPDLSLLRFTA